MVLSGLSSQVFLLVTCSAHFNLFNHVNYTIEPYTASSSYLCCCQPFSGAAAPPKGLVGSVSWGDILTLVQMARNPEKPLG